MYGAGCWNFAVKTACQLQTWELKLLRSIIACWKADLEEWLAYYIRTANEIRGLRQPALVQRSCHTTFTWAGHLSRSGRLAARVLK